MVRSIASPSAPTTRPSRRHRLRTGARKAADACHLRRLVVEPLEDRTLLSSGSSPSALATGPYPLATPLGGGTGKPVGLTPAQIEQAYGFKNITFEGGIQGDGRDQTIAIVDPYSDSAIVPSDNASFSSSDLGQFDAKFGLPKPTLTIVTSGLNVTPAPLEGGASPWAQEMALDVEWVHALAPKAAIDLVEAPGGTPDQIDANLIAGVNVARGLPGVSVISMSWTLGSTPSDATFTTPDGHQGITFVAGSGDNGALPTYPAASSNVLAVGGTYFPTQPDVQGDYLGELAWNPSGGGVVTTETQNPAQKQSIGDMGGRAAPDVAFDAGTAVAVYDSYDYGMQTPWVSVVGTSVSAPAWAALLAITDQGRVAVSEGTLDGVKDTIPDLYALSQSAYYTDAFNDITGDANAVPRVNAGYDLVTGLGTPKAAFIATALSGNVDAPTLIAPSANAAVTTTTPTLQWSSVSGAVGYVLTVTDAATNAKIVSSLGVIGTSYTMTTKLTNAHTYNWQVTVVTAAGGDAVPPPQSSSFTVVTIGTPTGSAPASSQTTTTPRFQWSTVPGAAGYLLTVVDTSAGTTDIDNQLVPSTSYTPSAPLTNLDAYEWTVSAYVNSIANGQPYASPASQSLSFTLDAPIAPSPISPGNEAVVTTTTPTLQWSPLTAAVSYNVTLIDVTDNNTPVVSGVSVPGPSYTPTTPLYDSELYEWYVQAVLSIDGSTMTSPTSVQTYFWIAQVGEPSLVSPAPGATVTTATPTLQWSAVPGADSGYAISLFDVTAGISLATYLFVSDTSYDVAAPLDNGHTYEWSVSSGEAGVSAISSDFTVSVPGGGAVNLPAPTLTSPDGVLATESPTLNWAAVPGAVEYGLYIFEGGSGGQSISAPVLTGATTYTLNLPNEDGILLHWFVKAYDSKGDSSPASQGLNFMDSPLVPGQPAAPTDLSPNGAINTYVPTFQFTSPQSSFPADVYGFGFALADETTGSAVISSGTGFGTYESPFSISLTDFGLAPLIAGHTYRWYVHQDGTVINGTSSPAGAVATQTFTVSPPPITAPAPTYPDPGGVASAITPRFQWSTVADAVSYILYISDPVYPAYNTFNYGVRASDNSYTPTTPLLNGHTYLWQVAAVVDSGGTETDGPPSIVAEFTVSAPGTPTLQAPASGATITTANPTFQWSAAGGASGYHLYLTDTTSSTAILGGLPVNGTSYTIAQPLNSGDSYQWSVQAYDNYGDVGASQSLNFTVSLPAATIPTPDPTGPIGQVKGATVTLKWSPVASAVGYVVYANDTTTKQPIPGSPFTASAKVTNGEVDYPLSAPLPPSDAYSWYVRAINPNDALGPQGPSASFTVSTSTDLASPPTPSSPSGSAATATPTFQWSAVSNAEGYEIQILQVSTNAVSYVLYPTPITEGTSYAAGSGLVPGGQYQWQVAAYDNDGLETAWSSPLTFQVAVSPPAPASPSGPTTSAAPTFRWSTAAGATGYRIEVFDVTGGGDAVVLGPTDVAGTSYTPPAPLTIGHNYQWQVLAYASSGAASAWSAPASFFVLLSTPTPASPSGTTNSTTPTLHWSAVSGAAGYQVEIVDVTGRASTIVVSPTDVVDISYTPGTALTPGHAYQWQVAAFDSSGAVSAWSGPTSFAIPPAGSPSPGSTTTTTTTTSTTPPFVTGLAGVTHVKKKVSAFTIAFDEALRSASADSVGFYQVARVLKKHRKIVYGKPVKIASVSYDGSRDVTVRLTTPVKGPLRLLILPGILGADGTPSASGGSATAK